MLRCSGRLSPAFSGSLITLSLACLIPLCFIAPARAQSPAITGFQGETVYDTGDYSTIGFEFVPQKSIIITHVGVYDHEMDGMVDPHEVGIWDLASRYGGVGGSGGIELGRASIPVNTPREGNFRYVPIAPILLPAGRSYVIGALWRGGKDPYVRNHTALSTDPAIKYVNNRVILTWNNALSYPSESNSSDKGYFGPNFKFILAPEQTQDTFDGSFNAQIPWQFIVPGPSSGGWGTGLIDTQRSPSLSFSANTWNVLLNGIPGTSPVDTYGGLYGNSSDVRNLLNFEAGAVPFDWYVETAVSLDLSKLTTYADLCKYPQAGLAIFSSINSGIWISLTNDARRQIADGVPQERRSVIQVGVQTSSFNTGNSDIALYKVINPLPADATFVRFRLEGRGTSGGKTGFLSFGNPGYYLYTDYGTGGALQQLGQPDSSSPTGAGPTFFQGDTRLSMDLCYSVLSSFYNGKRVGLMVDNWGTQAQLTARYNYFSTNLVPSIKPMVKGRVALQGLAATAAPRPVTYAFTDTNPPPFTIPTTYSFNRMVGPTATLQDFAFQIPAGTYNLTITAKTYLRVKTSVVVTNGSNLVLPDLTLLVGDVNNDAWNTINLTDLVQLRNNYGKTGTDLVGDLNGDGRVNLADLVLLRSNYGKQGAQ